MRRNEMNSALRVMGSTINSEPMSDSEGDQDRGDDGSDEDDERR